MTETAPVALRQVEPPRLGEPAAQAEPELRREGLGYRYLPRGYALSLHADYLRERSDEVTAEVTVESRAPGLPTHLHQARLNLVSTTQRASLVKHLAQLTRDETPWSRLVEQFCIGVLRRMRQGEPVVRVGHLPERMRRPDLVERLLPAGKPTIWYGPGGVGKGFLAVAAALCHETGRALAGLRVQRGCTLYLDWEDNEYSLNDRVQALLAGLELPEQTELAYRKCRKPLVKDINAITRHVQEVGADLVIVDSFGAATGASGERSYEDIAISFFEALRLLEPVTVLVIDHVTGQDAREGVKVAGRPFGSIFKLNEARCAWELRSEQEPGELTTVLGCYHTKFNHSLRYPPVGLRLEFSESDPGDPPVYVRIGRHELAESGHLKNLPLPDQISSVLRHGPRTVAELADELGEEANKLRAVLSRGRDRLFLHLPDGRWVLAAGYLEP